jgi:DNA-binding response OmpR family regulator
MKSIPILLIDDDLELCSSFKRLLSMDGFNVTAVHDADSGARHASNPIISWSSST